MMKTTIVQDGGNTVTLQYSSLFPLPSALPKPRLPNLRRGLLASITVSLSSIAGISSTNGASVTLYDSSMDTLPENQGWLKFGNANRNVPDLSPIAREGHTSGSGYTNVDSTTNNDNNIYAGYSNYNANVSFSPISITPSSLVNSSFPALDRNAGYTISFAVQIISQVNDGSA